MLPASITAYNTLTMSAATCTATNDFQVPKSKKRPSAKNLPRVYIGNLPAGSVNDLETQLQNLVRETANLTVAAKDIAITRPRQNQKTCHAFVSCTSNKDIDLVISALHQHPFQGQKLVAQRERKPKKTNGANTNNHKGKGFQSNNGGTGASFGSSSWSKPPKKQQPDPSPTNTLALPTKSPTTHDDPAVEYVSSLITEEMDAACSTGEQNNVINTALASLAAVSLLAPVMDATNATEEESKEAQAKDIVSQENPIIPTEEVTTLDDFRSRCQKPLSELLADYGEEDPDWQSMQPQFPLPSAAADTAAIHPETPEATTATTTSNAPNSTTENRPGRKGKAPIHVEFVSFGYDHGAPAAIRNGWHHAQPLPVFGCRDLPCVPGYLAWRDGVSGYVQRTLLTEPDVRDMANKVKEQTFEALVEAIDDGGHGYVSPLQMKIYVGSDSGRHRSVVVCEQAAKWLRHLLRMNENNRISVPVSVGTFHRNVDRAKKTNNDKVSRRKGELEGDW